jgi:hypothetical protein
MAQVAKRKARVAAAGQVKRKSGASVANSDAASKLASAIEDHMTDLGLSEDEKNERVARFTVRVNSALARRAKS